MITILFGAGASYGSEEKAGIPTLPPLGKDLFGFLDDRYGCFSTINDNIKKVFVEDGFEAGMANVSNDSLILYPIQRAMACFLSDFDVTTENAYFRLFRQIKLLIPNITLATLNYDLLIERALERNNIFYDYNDNRNGRGCGLIKLHGSSNFIPKIPNGNKIVIGHASGLNTVMDGLETHSLATYQEIFDWCHNPDNSSLAPILSVYNHEKQNLFNDSIIKMFQSKYKERILESNLIIVIGVEYLSHDKHVWEPIEQSNAQIVCVNPYPRSLTEWKKCRKDRRVKIIEKGFYNVVNQLGCLIRCFLKKSINHSLN
ncbi:hypothetical protein [Prodigiosinella confusarubida]|nr:hypothetical protein [Serratia sp. ATCC 39006]